MPLRWRVAQPLRLGREATRRLTLSDRTFQLICEPSVRHLVPAAPSRATRVYTLSGDALPTTFPHPTDGLRRHVNADPLKSSRSASSAVHPHSRDVQRAIYISVPSWLMWP